MHWTSCAVLAPGTCDPLAEPKNVVCFAIANEKRLKMFFGSLGHRWKNGNVILPLWKNSWEKWTFVSFNKEAMPCQEEVLFFPLDVSIWNFLVAEKKRYITEQKRLCRYTFCGYRYIYIRSKRHKVVDYTNQLQTCLFFTNSKQLFKKRD